jgi:hypothetical protein
MDDCWEEKNPPRDPTTKQLRGDAKRFPSGMKALGDYVHAANLSFAMYTAESTETCGGYPASANYEVLDAQTFNVETDKWWMGGRVPAAWAFFPLPSGRTKICWRMTLCSV